MCVQQAPVLLIVDDEPANIDLLRHLLRDRYRIKAATSGARALAIAQKTPPPDAIVLDVMMPGMDGFAVCEQLRLSPATANIPVLFVSGHTDSAGRDRALALGARAFLTKPVDAIQLRDCLRDAINNASLS